MKPMNLLFILSDQHNRNVSGCYGHPLVQTPNIDRLAAGGSLFRNAYTTSPICVPARASLATGQYVHRIAAWDNAHPYTGDLTSWHRRLREGGYRVDSIGKLHFRGADPKTGDADDNGFSQEIEPLNIVGGIGDVLGCIREDPPFRHKRDSITGAGPGDSTYLQYDIRNGDNAVKWISDHADDDAPWALFASFVCPHQPYNSFQELYDLYPLDQIEMPPQWHPDEWPRHPALDYFRRFFDMDTPFAEDVIRKQNAAYMGACTHLDNQIGRMLKALENNGLSENTRIIYTSDHGDSIGARGLFGKFTMYEESAAVPFIMAGPDVPRGKVVETPVSWVDCYPTIIEALGASTSQEDADLLGRSLWEIAEEPNEDRTVFSEYHAVGCLSGHYMLRDLKYKYIHYVGEPVQLFDLEADPLEFNDLSSSPAHREVLGDFESRLRSILDPEAVDAEAKRDQEALVEAHGGKDAVIACGTFDHSPVPGQKADFGMH